MEVRPIDNVEIIREEWEELLGESATGTVWQHPVWVRTWQRHVNGKLKIENGKFKLLILGVYDGEELVGVGVFEITKGTDPPAGGTEGTKIRFLGMRKLYGYGLSDYGDVVAKRGREEEVWRELLKFLNNPLDFAQGKQFFNHQFIFDYIREESPSFEVVPRVARELGLKLSVEKQEVAPYLRLPETWEEYLESLERKKRHELRRKMRRIEEVAGEMEIGVEWDKKQFDRFVVLVKASSAEKREFMNEKMQEFFGEMMKQVFRARMGKLFCLKIEERVVAMVFGFEFKKGWYLYNGGFEGENTGIALSGMIVKEAISRGVEIVDFLRGSEGYKYELGARDQQLYRLTLKP